MAKEFEFGLSQAVYSVFDEAEGTYGEVKSLLAQGVGMLGANLSPVGDANEYYADNVIWDNSVNNNGYDGSIDMTALSKDFLKDVMGYTEDARGVLFENKNDAKKHFAFGFVVDGNEKDVKTWYYYVSASRPSDEHATNEAGRTYATKSLDIQARPRPTDGEVKSRALKGEDAYDDFFDTVYEKTTSA